MSALSSSNPWIVENQGFDEHHLRFNPYISKKHLHFNQKKHLRFNPYISKNHLRLNLMLLKKNYASLPP